MQSKSADGAKVKYTLLKHKPLFPNKIFITIFKNLLLVVCTKNRPSADYA
jgi:hypothetical protein